MLKTLSVESGSGGIVLAVDQLALYSFNITMRVVGGCATESAPFSNWSG